MKTKILIFAVVVLVVAGYFFGTRILFQMDWEQISQKKSPNEEFTIKHYQSISESGHAPYGDNLVIESWKSFPHPKEGETFFAGYCGNSMQYEWVGNNNILIICNTGGEPFRTHAVLVHGIEVNVVNE